MAIDTEHKRRSVQNYGFGPSTLPPPSSSITEPDRYSLLWMYSGLDYSGPLTLFPSDCAQGQVATSPTVDYTRPLTVNDAVQTQVVTEPLATYILVFNFIPDDCIQTQVVASPDPTFTFQLEVNSCVQPQFVTGASFVTGVLKSCLTISNSVETCLAASNNAEVCMDISHE